PAAGDQPGDRQVNGQGRLPCTPLLLGDGEDFSRHIRSSSVESSVCGAAPPGASFPRALTRLDAGGQSSRAMAVLNPTRDVLEEAARHLRAGGLVAFPTETVYGLGGDATSARAVAAIFDLKGRPKFNPLIIHVPSIEAAERLVQMDERARYLAKRCWPGALT